MQFPRRAARALPACGECDPFARPSDVSARWAGRDVAGPAEIQQVAAGPSGGNSAGGRQEDVRHRLPASLLLPLWLSASCLAGYEYSVTIIDTPGCGVFGPTDVIPGGINDQGHVTGTIDVCGDGDYHAFIWTPEAGLTVLGDLPDSAYTKGYAISNAGLVAAEWTGSPSAGGYTGMIYDDGAVLDLPPLPGGTNSLPYAIRDDGVVVGEWGNTVVGPYPLPGMWINGALVDLTEQFGGPTGSAWAVNAWGTVVGWTGTSWGRNGQACMVQADGTASLLPALSESTFSMATAVNNLEEASGWTKTIESSVTSIRGLVWSGKKTVVIPPVPGLTRSAVNAMNDLGQVVGQSWAGGPSAGFLWQDGALVNIQATLVPPGSQINVTWAEDINNRGQILCRSTLLAGLNAHVVSVILTLVGVIQGDINLDAVVDAHDVELLIAAWGATVPQVVQWADVNHDQIVDGADLGIVLSHYGDTVSPRP